MRISDERYSFLTFTTFTLFTSFIVPDLGTDVRRMKDFREMYMMYISRLFSER